MTYCEITSKENQEKQFAIHDITENQLAALNSLLNGNSNPGLSLLRKAVYSEIGLANDKILAEQESKIELCVMCRGSGKILVGNLHELHNNDIESCPKCKGKRSRVKITSVRYEQLSDYWDRSFAT